MKGQLLMHRNNNSRYGEKDRPPPGHNDDDDHHHNNHNRKNKLKPPPPPLLLSQRQGPVVVACPTFLILSMMIVLLLLVVQYQYYSHRNYNSDNMVLLLDYDLWSSLDNTTKTTTKIPTPQKMKAFKNELVHDHHHHHHDGLRLPSPLMRRTTAESRSTNSSITTTKTTTSKNNQTGALVQVVVRELQKESPASLLLEEEEQQQNQPEQDQQQLEMIFYQDHHAQIKALVNESTVLDWDARRYPDPFRPFFDHFDDNNNHNPNINQPTKTTTNTKTKISSTAASRRTKSSPPFQKNQNKHDNTTIIPFQTGEICRSALRLTHYKRGNYRPRPHVLFLTPFNENWGGLSTHIPNRTFSNSRNLTREWIRHHCSRQMIHDYLDHPSTLGVVTVQFQDIYHPKVVSLPLGIPRSQVAHLLEQLQALPTHDNRSQLLMINSKPRQMRVPILDRVIANFRRLGVPVQNTYNSRGGGGGGGWKRYYEELRHSKFILSPGGLGLDCYRHWEALYMGTIPVLETLNRTDGWFRTFDDLPVAWIDSYDNLTPQWLQDEYRRIMMIVQRRRRQQQQQQQQLVQQQSAPPKGGAGQQRQQGLFRYEKLTKQYWIELVRSFATTTS